MTFPIIRLHPQKHRRVQGGHPWVYSNEIVMDGAAKALPRGSLAAFYAHDQKFLGIGSFNANCLIAGRIFTPHLVEEIGEDWLATRIENALRLREHLVSEPFYRLIHAEADGLPGLIVDRFDDALCVQMNTAGMDALSPALESALRRVLKPRSLILRNDSFAREIEGLPRETKLIGEEIPTPTPVRQNHLTYFADLRGGQKTGWYFDQRDNHALVAAYAKKADSVLDLYTHAGGFALAAAKAGAEKVIGVDSSEPALALARQAAEFNGLAARCDFQRADVFEDLEKRIAAKERHQIVIADPPAFVKSRKDVASGSRAYRKLAKMAASVTKKNGFLFIASCSHNMELPNFIEQVAAGLNDAKRTGKILHTSFAAADHPTHPNLPESAYLKGLLLFLAE
ncbi:MAG: class I SAM-dependent rRNA methyltransferase [Alphaproteobacteria bacterium]|nr:class I SAM-dependent rRNA methyltransferase [Alphaproteobacteria bacterium]